MSQIKYPIGAYAPGNYMNECITCETEFMGDKYARQCEPCAINTLNEGYVKLVTRNQHLEGLLRILNKGIEDIEKLVKEKEDS